MPSEKCKPQGKPAQYNQPAKKQKTAHKVSATSTQPPVAQFTTRSNLTLSDWMTVFAYVDSHPTLPQNSIVEHFQTLKSGALIFTQSTLCRKLQDREALEVRVHDNPNAFSLKRPHIVTRPDIERALVLWVQQMENKGETVSGPMLQEKRSRFEEEFDVPENERLPGDGWIASFCKAYGIQEHKRHGEAGSVDTDAVEEEHIRCCQILAKFAPTDRFNFDETGFFPFAPPGRGLATKKMSGKKKEKTRITIGVACNADGSEKLELFFIGKAQKPCCFKKKTPEQRGFYYHNNETAWMTAILFEKNKFDIKMKQQNQYVLLIIDNFSSHTIPYEPTNIQLEFFKPNLTPFVQPCNAGIICYFKAIYHCKLSIHAIDLDEAGEPEIYTINLLEAMLTAKSAWDAVSLETIKHC
ncbi:DDE-domain-containing protein [Gyrodon lividus]|nr:DDE-domain-containing protein [Gyrodon lividus]KAF9223951.1 DDE-domain-containing protein [Gyrodon lividus]